MKTIEEKARAYDKLIERLKDFQFEYRFSPFSDIISDKFPEIKESKESEDEKIRKRIIHALHGDVLDMEETTKAIAWLEKQGEKKSIDDLTQQEAMDIAVAKCFEQGEQKPADKVEPKFKVGTWVILKSTGSAYKVIKVGTYQYTLEHISGGTVFISFNNERLIRLWTIKDAKDGDILQNVNYNNATCIFKNLTSDGKYIYAYCGISCSGEFEPHAEDVWWGNANKYVPATKEQRDAFFATRKKAGYIWDNELKRMIWII